MKINHRIILVNLLIVAIVLGSSAIAFYSILYNTLTSQQSKNIISSSRNFIFTYRTFLDNLDNEFWALKNQNPEQLFAASIPFGYLNDFFLEAEITDSIKILRYSAKNPVQIPSNNFTISEFIQSNPYAVISLKKVSDKTFCYYGKILNNNVLDDLSKRIGSDIALIWDNFTAEVSNANTNSQHIFLLTKAHNFLSLNNEQEIFLGESETSDIIAVSHKIDNPSRFGNNLSFLLFKSHSEVTELRETLRNILILIGVVGFILAIILTYLLTHKMRKRISELNYATTQTTAGNFDFRVEVKNNDEISNLGKAFNIMLDELKKNQKAKNEYSDFITLINQNATLTEISNAALKKIIETCGFVVGAVFSVDDGEVIRICTYGLKNSEVERGFNEFYSRIITDKKLIELSSQEELPFIQTGSFDIKLGYLLLLPVIYNNKVIAILELGSLNKPTLDALDYLDKIQEQLAIGLTNSKAVAQLENFVLELKVLNEEYQKQNIQIKKQNETLFELSNQLKVKAEELAIQKQKAEDSTKLKSQFLASMSHELRTPMNSILGLTELILDKAQLSPRNRERLEVVLKSGKRLMSLINDILDLSKIEAGKMEIREEDVLLEEIIEDIIHTSKPLAVEKGLSFEVKRFCNTRIIISTDRVRVTQVLINLIGNAIKFTPSGHVELTISVSEDKTILFSVADTGIGISEENRKIIFEEFRQVDGSTSKKFGGTGLGLAISKKILDLLGGKIWVNSVEGNGSVFSFTIPIKLVSDKSKNELYPINSDYLKKNINNPVLVIDDDPEVRYTIGQYLTSKGYPVIFAKTGEEGIRLAQEKQPFAITLDLLLPGKDGWSVLRDLKENQSTSEIPVILISIIGDKDLGFSLGAFEYFIKPFSSEKLLSAFNKLETIAQKRIKKILLVDDDEFEFIRFKREFENENISIEFIQDSEFAFNKIAEVEPDLIILDLLMPKVDGITLAQRLKSDNKTKHIPIIISTAKNLSEDENNYLTKIVEDITLKSADHPKDILKIVRDRLQIQERSKELIEEEPSNSIEDKQFDSGEEIVSKTLAEILIVDDDPDTLFTLDEIVQSMGCKTHLAKSGFECIRILDNVKPDLIMLDIMMPDMDGFQTLKSIRSIKELEVIPVYAVTAKAMVGDKEIILKHGFNDYIAKPVNSSVIYEKISKLLSKIKTN